MDLQSTDVESFDDVVGAAICLSANRHDILGRVFFDGDA